MRLAIVGHTRLTHVGDALRRAALRAGHRARLFDSALAFEGARPLRALSWRLRGRRPLQLEAFSEMVVAACQRLGPDVLVATGTAPLIAGALEQLKTIGVFCVNYSTDDPWNPAHKARWHQRALPFYNAIFTTRRSNIADFQNLGCRDVRYLPFGYDPGLFSPLRVPASAQDTEVLFVGGADRDRVAFVESFARHGPPITLVGGYWERFAKTKSVALGHRQPEELRVLTAAAKVNLCLVRKANRDGHVMRSFEIAAVGGCMLAEDTVEHRELFGEDGECVRYFQTPLDAAQTAHRLIDEPSERARLSRALCDRISAGKHTYADRLAAMLASAPLRSSETRVLEAASA